MLVRMHRRLDGMPCFTKRGRLGLGRRRRTHEAQENLALALVSVPVGCFVGEVSLVRLRLRLGWIGLDSGLVVWCDDMLGAASCHLCVGSAYRASWSVYRLTRAGVSYAVDYMLVAGFRVGRAVIGGAYRYGRRCTHRAKVVVHMNQSFWRPHAAHHHVVPCRYSRCSVSGNR